MMAKAAPITSLAIVMIPITRPTATDAVWSRSRRRVDVSAEGAVDTADAEVVVVAAGRAVTTVDAAGAVTAPAGS